MDYESGAVSPVDTISEGWDLIKDNYWVYVLMVLVLVIVLFAVSMIGSLISNIVTYAVMLILGTNKGGTDAATAGVLISQVVSMGVGLAFNLVSATATGIMFAGFYRALTRTSLDGSAEFSDLFSAFDTWKACFVIAVIGTVLQLVVMVLALGIVGGGIVGTIGLDNLMSGKMTRNPEALGALMPFMFIGIIVVMIIMLVWTTLQTMVYPLIARGLPGVEAFMTSIRAGFSNFGGILLLLILTGLMLFAGALACLIGALFVAPIVYASLFRASERIFGKEQVFGNNEPPSPDQYGFNPRY